MCAPVERMPKAGELVMTDRLALTVGGCAANAAVDLSRLGVSVQVAGRVGDDVFGRFVVDRLREWGVGTAGVQVTPETDTSQTLIVNVRGQDRRFLHSFGANGRFTGADIPLERVRDCRVLYVGGYLLTPALTQDDLVPVFQTARSAGVTTVLDVGVPEPGEYMNRLDRLLPLADFFLPNIDEAKAITGIADPVSQADRFREAGAETVVVTCGAEGSVLVSRENRLRAGTYTIDFVDGSGCGDAFDAGFIFGLLEGYDAEMCLRWASALGASCVRAIGTTAGVFTRQEAEAFVGEQPLQIERI